MADLVITKDIIRHQDIPSIFTDNKPILFWDTCSLLYFNTLVGRGAYDEYRWDKHLLELVENNKVYSATSSVVYQEFNKHHIAFREKDENNELGLKSAMKEYGKQIGGSEEQDLLKGMAALHLSTTMEDMVCRIWKNTYVIEEDIIFHQLAHNRVLESIAPSSPKKQEYKDCYIWETFMSLCDNAPHKDALYFMTENTHDYCGESSKAPLPDIQKDLDTRGGKIMTTKRQLWAEAAKKVGLVTP